MQQIYDIASQLDSLSLGTIGTDLFIYYAPPSVNNCIILYPSNDPPVIDPDTPAYFKGKFQTIVRNMTHEGGMKVCADLETNLTMINVDLDTIFVKMCRPMYQPRVFRRAESGIIEFSVTYDITFIVK